ncbi:MAG: hypothetical protein RMJ54_18480, partial [Roseiflexaceae bacterium]|nr:hypothetical protein [Roseiflexaceae bacterium]
GRDSHQGDQATSIGAYPVRRVGLMSLIEIAIPEIRQPVSEIRGFRRKKSLVCQRHHVVHPLAAG